MHFGTFPIKIQFSLAKYDNRNFSSFQFYSDFFPVEKPKIDILGFSKTNFLDLPFITSELQIKCVALSTIFTLLSSKWSFQNFAAYLLRWVQSLFCGESGFFLITTFSSYQSFAFCCQRFFLFLFSSKLTFTCAPHTMDDLTIGTSSSSQESSSSSDSGSEDQNTTSPGEPAEKLNNRRLKNRESAARSRMRIKNTLTILEKEYQEKEELKEKLMNEKELLRNEVNSLENQMIAMSLSKMDKNLFIKKYLSLPV